MPTPPAPPCHRVGSRKSQLALMQTRFVVAELQRLNPGHSFPIVEMATLGDKVLDKALSQIGEKSLFTKELEVALDVGEVDLVVHSLKDLPTSLPPGMVIGAVLERHDPRDAVLVQQGLGAHTLAELAEGAVVGTSSLRRAAQLRAAFPHLRFQDVRGNLNTRLRKLDDPSGPYSALVLAVAGVERMGWGSRVEEVLEEDVCMHAVGQGALAVECRQEDRETLRLLAPLHHRETVLATIAERAFMKTLEGGCSVPVAVVSEVREGGVTLRGGVWSLDGATAIKGENKVTFDTDDDLEGGPVKRVCPNSTVHFAAVFAELLPHSQLAAAEACGVVLARDLLSRGAGDVLRAARQACAPINQAPRLDGRWMEGAKGEGGEGAAKEEKGENGAVKSVNRVEKVTEANSKCCPKLAKSGEA